MATKYTWKDKYYNTYNQEVSETATYFSKLGRIAATGSKDDPYNETKYVKETGATVGSNILGAGSFVIQSYGYNEAWVGQGMDKTFVNHHITYAPKISFKDLCLTNFTGEYGGQVGGDYINCMINFSFIGGTFSGCVIRASITGAFTNNTFADTDFLLTNKYSIATNCSIVIDQAVLTSDSSNFIGFHKCRYRIGAETTYTPINGNNKDELYADFVARCVAQGLTVPATNWIFSDNSISGYDIITGSEMDQFQKLNNTSIGYSTETVTDIPITLNDETPEAFTKNMPVGDNIDTSEGSLSLSNTIDITNPIKQNTSKQSKIIWLGGIKRLKAINTVDTLLNSSGVALDSLPSISDIPVTVIEDGHHYIVKSTDTSSATVDYPIAGTSYSSDLSVKNNVFIGESTTIFLNASANAQVFEIYDLAYFNTMKIRLVESLPSTTITSGNLQDGYWYYVVPNDVNNYTSADYITYKGINKPGKDSFIVDASDLTFVVVGNVSLARCWTAVDYDAATDSDKAFWSDKQKPMWMDVVPNDMRCLKVNNSASSKEMSTSAIDGKYIASGHPEFYNAITGANGTLYPSYDITGSWLQIEFDITTQNPM